MSRNLFILAFKSVKQFEFETFWKHLVNDSDLQDVCHEVRLRFKASLRLLSCLLQIRLFVESTYISVLHYLGFTHCELAIDQ